MSSVITQQMRALITECENLIIIATNKNRIDLVGTLNKLSSMIYSGKVSNSEVKKCLINIRQQLL